MRCSITVMSTGRCFQVNTGGEASTQHSAGYTYCCSTFHGWQNNIDVAVKKMAIKLSKIAISDHYSSDIRQLKQRWIFAIAQRQFCSPKKVIYILSALKDGEQFNEMVILDSFLYCLEAKANKCKNVSNWKVWIISIVPNVTVAEGAAVQQRLW